MLIPAKANAEWGAIDLFRPDLFLEKLNYAEQL